LERKRKTRTRNQAVQNETKPENEAQIEPTREQMKARASKRPMWSGSVTIGLINVPVKLYPMVYDRGITFHFLHKLDNMPLRYQKVCTKDDKIVPWDEVVKGYEVAKNEYLVFSKEELDAFKPESDRRIRVIKFIDYFSIDPIYYHVSYVLMPDKSNDSYGLLLAALQKMNKAGVGRITLRTKEYPAIVHPYKDALVLTTLRYAYDVVDPHDFEELKELKEPEAAELNLAKKIVQDLSGEFKIAEFKDSYRAKVQELIKKKMKGEKIIVEKPVEAEVKGLMNALRETIKQLETKPSTSK
jgi:DNA end-binding protein Ku